nr:immunoglobulin light chain junction region [Macaca mulatta]MOX43172.1 immunoglobulin light chain junction region [Macaca mulatta]MOX43716.1 immunoglobulin light chain junction region [Macaca mulatta]MOX45632.1 immunoglobulin light chain junction region [Macaca mulatta]MOX46419.1 immunoglobulin light chain junction region [Macaca mulatta]
DYYCQVGDTRSDQGLF